MPGKHAWSDWSGYEYNPASGRDESTRRCLDAACGETETRSRKHVHGNRVTLSLNNRPTPVCGICGATVK